KDSTTTVDLLELEHAARRVPGGARGARVCVGPRVVSGFAAHALCTSTLFVSLTPGKVGQSQGPTSGRTFTSRRARRAALRTSCTKASPSWRRWWLTHNRRPDGAS